MPCCSRRSVLSGEFAPKTPLVTDLGDTREHFRDFTPVCWKNVLRGVPRLLFIGEVLDGLTPDVIQSQAFNKLGSRTQLAAEIGGTDDFVNDYTYDHLQRLTRITQQSQSGGNAVAEKRFDLEYNKLGQASLLTRYADLAGAEMVATTTYSYDNAHRLTSLLHEQGLTSLAGYTYDEGNRITSIDSVVDGLTEYDHDNAGQLIDADHTGQTDEVYTYHDNGNRTMFGYVVGANNRVSSDGTYDYEYDDEGNMTPRRPSPPESVKSMPGIIATGW